MTGIYILLAMFTVFGCVFFGLAFWAFSKMIRGTFINGEFPVVNTRKVIQEQILKELNE